MEIGFDSKMEIWYHQANYKGEFYKKLPDGIGRLHLDYCGSLPKLYLYEGQFKEGKAHGFGRLLVLTNHEV